MQAVQEEAAALRAVSSHSPLLTWLAGPQALPRRPSRASPFSQRRPRAPREPLLSQATARARHRARNVDDRAADVEAEIAQGLGLGGQPGGGLVAVPGGAASAAGVSGVVPEVSVEPGGDIDAMTELFGDEVVVGELGAHRGHQVRVPVSL